ncbi:hypothetical protein TWF506_006235 [Arthrobotrys conoides]|uniref:NACHT domain-containing protein n=1 Tax=Arthrobotrys conoides TaxID=74498 RepID=A0AAN8NGG5_9PEZI
MSRPPKRSACCNLEDLDCCGQASARRTRAAPLPLTQDTQGSSNRVTEITEPDNGIVLNPGDSDEDSEAVLELEQRQDPFPCTPENAIASSSDTYKRPAGRPDFQIAIICALPIEYNAVSLLIDQWWDEGGKTYGRAPGDPNTYRNGRLGGHNVVLLLLPKMGKSSAAGSTASLRSSYYNISVALLVGICGGVPYVGKREILLGDVIIGERIFQYDFGRQYHNQHVPKAADEGNLGCLNKDLSSLIAYFKTEPGRQEVQKNAAGYLTALQKIAIDTKCETDYRYPGISRDKLFPASCQHKHQEPVECSTCNGENESYCREADKTACADLGCDDDMLVRRQRLKKKSNLGSAEEKQRPEIFVGNIASGDTVMRSSEHRDAIAIQGNLIAFEMEGAGAFDESPSLVIKGICDYADSHKNKEWQSFAAATAASVAKAVLERYTLPRISTTATQGKVSFDELDQKCLSDLRVTNPIDDKARITQTKGNLLKGSYIWILEHEGFKAWGRNEIQLLWITGDPGKGKTMLLCGLIEELGPATRLKDKNSDTLLSYFLFQGTDSRINNATSALRSLIYMLVNQHPALILAIREKYDASGKQLFQDPNAWFALSTIFTSILEDLGQRKVFLVIDALDECTTDLFKVLDLVIQTSKFPHVKWILSSRNITDIERKFQLHTSHTRLRLEKKENAKFVSNAVDTYIKHSISELKSVFEDEVEIKKLYDKMLKRSNNTFLWVSLITKELKGANSWELDQILEEFPKDLGAIYLRMIDQIKQQRPETQRLCSLILSVLSVVYRPLNLEEISVLPQLPNDISTKQGVVKKLVDQCGSFFTIRGGYVYIIHQSAMDFLLDEGIGLLLPSKYDWRTESHRMIFSRSLEVLSSTLRRDIYNLKEPGFLAENIHTPDQDPLISIRYSVVYWIDHFNHTNADHRSGDEETIHIFLKKHFLHWLEALSLIGKFSEGVRTIILLGSIIEPTLDPGLASFLDDARRFILYFGSMIQEAPLQTYCSALSFAPHGSLVRQQFQTDILHSFDVKPVRQGWGPLLHTFRSHSFIVRSIAISPDSKEVLSVSFGHEIVLWDLSTGRILKSVPETREPNLQYLEVAISPNGKDILNIPVFEGFFDGPGLWDVTTGLGEELGGDSHHSGMFEFAAFSADGKKALIAHRTKDSSCSLAIYDMELRMTAAHFFLENDGLALSPDGKTIAYVAGDALKLRNISSPDDVSSFQNDMSSFQKHSADQELDDSNLGLRRLLSFSPNGEFLALTFIGIVGLFSAATGKFTGSFRRYSSIIRSMSFSPDSKSLACGLEDTVVRLWNIDDGIPERTLGGHQSAASVIVFSPDSKIVATASGLTRPTYLKTTVSIRLWDVATGNLLQTLVGYNCRANTMAFSPDGDIFLLAAGDGIVRRWNVAMGEAMPEIKNQNRRQIYDPYSYPVMVWDRDTFVDIRILEAYGKPVYPMLFSPNGKTITVAFNTEDRFRSCNQQTCARIYSWDLETGAMLRSLVTTVSYITNTALSPDGRMVALTSNCGITLFDVETGSMRQINQTEWSTCQQISYSPCGKTIASVFAHSGSDDPSKRVTSVFVKVWDVATNSFVDNHSMKEIQCGQRLVPPVGGFLALSIDQEMVATTNDHNIVIYDAKTGAILSELVGGQAFYRIECGAFSPDGKTLITGSSDSTVRVWEVKAIRTMEQGPVDHHEGAVICTTISQDQDISASFSISGDVRLWNTITGRCLCSIPITSPTLLTQTATSITFTFSPDGTKLLGQWASKDDDDTEIRLIVLDKLGKRPAQFLLGPKTGVSTNITFSPDSKELSYIARVTDEFELLDYVVSEYDYLSWSRSQTSKREVWCNPSYELLVYDTSSGNLLRKNTVEAYGCSQPPHFRLSPNNEMLAFTTGSSPQSIKVQAIKGWEHISTIEGFGEYIDNLEFSQDSRFIMVRSIGKYITVYEVISGAIVWKYSGDLTGVLGPGMFQAIQLAPNSIYMRTKRGVLGIPVGAEGTQAEFLKAKDYPARFSKFLSTSGSKEWILLGGRRILRLPSDYTVTPLVGSKSSFRENLLALGMENGMVLFIRS